MIKLPIIPITICVILGTILHFTYELSNCNKIVAVFSSTNESTWEHLKLSFFPIIIVGIFEYFIIGNSTNNFITSKMIAVLIAMAFTIIAFYTYTGIIGKNNFIVDISIFVLGIIFSQITSYKIMTFEDLNLEIISSIIIIIVTTAFIVFTNSPPKIKLFEDPITKDYGPVCKNNK